MADFALRLQAFLQPTNKSIKLSKAARAKEDLYYKAHEAFLDKDRSTCMDINMEIVKSFLIYHVTNDQDRFWKMNLMARSNLLLAHFQYKDKNSLTFGLNNSWGEARIAVEKLKDDSDHWTKQLWEVRDLCGEMYWRLLAEEPRERFVFDDGEYVWTLRMTADWLQATDNWLEKVPNQRRKYFKRAVGHSPWFETSRLDCS